MHLKNENERNMFMHLENMMMIPFSAPLAPSPSPAPTWPTYTLDTIAQINFHENCQQPNGEGRRKIIQQFWVFVLFFPLVFVTRKFLGFSNLLFLPFLHHTQSHVHYRDSRATRLRAYLAPRWWLGSVQTIEWEKLFSLCFIFYYCALLLILSTLLRTQRTNLWWCDENLPNVLFHFMISFKSQRDIWVERREAKGVNLLRCYLPSRHLSHRARVYASGDGERAIEPSGGIFLHSS